MKKILSAILAVLMVAAVLVIPATAENIAKTVPFTATAPVKDGVKDAAYDKALVIDINKPNTWGGTVQSGFSAKAYLLHDGTNLYIFAEAIGDKTIAVNHANAYSNDAFSPYFYNGAGTLYTSGWYFNRNGAEDSLSGAAVPILSKTVSSDDAWAVEMVVPLAKIKQTGGDTALFDISYLDLKADNSRNIALGAGNNGWATAAGNALKLSFAEKPLDPIPLLGSTCIPTVDGVKDDVWAKAVKVPLTSVHSGTAAAGFEANVYMLADATYVYFFLEALNDKTVANDDKAGSRDDGFQIFYYNNNAGAADNCPSSTFYLNRSTVAGDLKIDGKAIPFGISDNGTNWSIEIAIKRVADTNHAWDLVRSDGSVKAHFICFDCTPDASTNPRNYICTNKGTWTNDPTLAEQHPIATTVSSSTCTKVTGQAATCTEAGWKDYYQCPTCGKCFTAADHTSPIADLAAWKNGDGKIAPAHKTTKVAGQAAGAVTDGWKDYYQCTVEGCKKYFEDEKATVAIADLEAWKKGEGKIPAIHSLTKVDGQAAGAVTDGWKDYYACSVDGCGKYFEDEKAEKEITDLEAWKKGEGKIPALHTLTKVEGKPAGAVTEGWKSYYQCTVDGCDKLFEDENAEKEITDLEAWKVGDGKIPAGHSLTKVDGQPAGAVTDGWKDYYQCTIEGCGKFYEDEAAEKEIEDLEAWKTGEGKIPAIHTLTKVDGQAAGAVTDGWKDYYQCTVEGCDKYFEDEKAEKEITDLEAWKKGDGKVPAIHSLTKVDGKAPTETEDGWKDYYQCTVEGCAKYFEDEKAEKEIADLEAWKTGDGKLEATGTEPIETEPIETEPKETEPKETEPKETEPKETKPADPAATGDAMIALAALALVSMIALAGVQLGKKR